MKKAFVILVLICLTAAVISGCFWNKPVKTEKPVEINPNQESVNLEKVPVTLYFQYKNDFLLAGESRTIEAPVNGRLENAVIKALIDGPLANNQRLNALIDPSTKIVNVSEEGEYLFVTLSKDFIKQELTDESAKKRRQLAVYSLADTLIELGGYARIHLRIDKDGTGIGQSITKAEAGFEGGDSALEPIGFYSPAVLNPKNTVNEFLTSYANKDWEKVYEMVALRDISGDQKPSQDEFLSGVVSFQYGIDEFEVLDYYTDADAKTAVAMINFSMKTKDGENNTKKNIPIKLLRENNLWRISYSAFKKAFSF